MFDIRPAVSACPFLINQVLTFTVLTNCVFYVIHFHLFKISGPVTVQCVYD